MTEISKCPKCNGEFVYFDGSLYVCPDCGHEFNEEDIAAAESADIAKDSNGVELLDGDSVTVIKDLKVKGSSMVIKHPPNRKPRRSRLQNRRLQHRPKNLLFKEIKEVLYTKQVG